jgi:hypothetical protein
LKKFAVAKVFTADNIDVSGSTAQNPVDLTGDNYADDEPMSITQSLPYSGDSTRMGSGLQIDISQELQLNRPAIISISGIIGVGKTTLMEILS